jgi:hypothetical protein
MTGLIKGLQPYSPHWKNHGTGGGTSFTLDVSSTTNATILIVGGVIQLAGTDYTVSGTTVTTTTSVTSGVEVISAVLYDLGSVTTPAAGSVNFDSLGFTSQAQGDILYRDSSTWARLPAGTSGQYLQTQGAGANPTWADSGGAWSFINSSTFSGASNYTFTAFDSSKYDVYVFMLINVICADDARHLQMLTSTDGGSSYDTGASDYNWALTRCAVQTSDSGVIGDFDADDASIGLTGSDSGGANVIGSAAGEHGVSGQIWCHNPASTQNTQFTWNLMFQANTPESVVQPISGGGQRSSAADVDAIKIQFSSSSNIESGEINAYGVKNS